MTKCLCGPHACVMVHGDPIVGVYLSLLNQCVITLGICKSELLCNPCVIICSLCSACVYLCETLTRLLDVF